MADGSGQEGRGGHTSDGATLASDEDSMAAVIGRVVLDINGRPHSLGCAPGEERRLLALGEMFDQRVRELSGVLGNIGDANLYLAAALTFLDERAPLHDPETERRLSALEDRAAETLIKAAERIEDLASRLRR